ncbi:sugar ABC transporter substrate-binding protein [Xanthobacter aminoxidans]|uniref:sugar ABC transporter substrate-binding protein n=1 Tax=Xanthobacter aminoxidans TaxID=186280 RepID=UPI002022D375|nr:substrate-binding domain-containing protein [Xanthobacter aminoxidans]MCL8385419.1 substrate-binding domain-containing protein [Xanthobacter aminoxidans]
MNQIETARTSLLASFIAALAFVPVPALAQAPVMTKEAPAASSPLPSPTPGQSAGAPTPKQGLRIGMLIPHRTNPFWVAFAKSSQEAAKALNVDLRIVDHENREEKQIDTLQGLIAGGVDGLIVVPYNTQMGPAILDMAAKSQIPVTIADRWPGVGPESGKYIGFVGTNDEQAGYNIASALLRQGCTKIVVNNGVRGVSLYQARTRGRTKATTEHPEVQILRDEYANSVRAAGANTMEAWLTALPGPEFDCLYGGNDDWAMGAWKILSDRGVADKVKIAGFDAIPEVIEKLKQGSFSVSAGGNWHEGPLSVVQMYDYLHGLKPAKPISLVSVAVVTKDNAAKFEEKFYKNPTVMDWKQRSRVFNADAPADFVVQVDKP